MKKTALPDLYYWGRFQPDRELDFNGFYWAGRGGGVLFDPMELSADERAALDAKGGAKHIVLTNFDHLRAAPELASELGAEVWAPDAERARFGDSAELVHHWFTKDGGLPRELGITPYEMRGGKSEVEMALLIEPLRALLFGDVVRVHEAGRLRILPEPKLSDRSALIASLAPLASLELDAVLVGDGDSIYYRASEAFHELLASLR